MILRTLSQLSFGLVAVTVIFLMSSCQTRPLSNQEKAVAVAEREVVGRGWKHFKVRDIKKSAEKWIIAIQELPAIPGGHAVIEVSTEGKVIAFYPGD